MTETGASRLRARFDREARWSAARGCPPADADRRSTSTRFGDRVFPAQSPQLLRRLFRVRAFDAPIGAPETRPRALRITPPPAAQTNRCDAHRQAIAERRRQRPWSRD